MFQARHPPREPERVRPGGEQVEGRPRRVSLTRATRMVARGFRVIVHLGRDREGKPLLESISENLGHEAGSFALRDLFTRSEAGPPLPGPVGSGWRSTGVRPAWLTSRRLPPVPDEVFRNVPLPVGTDG